MAYTLHTETNYMLMSILQNTHMNIIKFSKSWQNKSGLYILNNIHTNFKPTSQNITHVYWYS